VKNIGAVDCIALN